jgi:beta-galactosidase
MGYSYSYNGGYKVEGYGMNPALADARSKTDKDIAGLISSQEQNKVRVFAYTNAEQIEIADGETKGVIFYHILATKPTQFVFQAEVKHLAESTETVAADTYTNTDLTISAVENLNGDDLVYLTAAVTDKDGILCPHASNRITFSVAGAGELLTTDAGDQRETESFARPDKKALAGYCVACVRSLTNAGEISVTAEAEGLKSTHSVILSK